VSSRALSELHLADLHARASEVGVEGYRLMRREDLVAAIEGASRAAADLEEADTDEIPVIGAMIGEKGEGAVEVDAEGAREKGAEEPTVEVVGVLELTRQRFGFLRLSGLHPGPDDVYISAAQVRRCELRPGDEVAGPAREPRRGERHRALVHVDRVHGTEPLAEERPDFDALAPVLAERRLPLDSDPGAVLARAVDLLAPLALGQRMLVRAAPRSGRTTLLREIARAVTAAERTRLIVLLVDERPEEATAWRESATDAEFAIATADLAPRDQLHVAELALERGRRLAETGEDAVLVCDSLSRLAFVAGDAAEVKRLFGSGRNLVGGGSLTVVATVLADSHDEGEAERAVATTESALVTLDPDLAAAGVTPAIRPAECRVSNEDQLRDAAELEAIRRLRSLLVDLDPAEAAHLLRERIEGSASNADLLAAL
jgi:transcription termination factor Rho